MANIRFKRGSRSAINAAAAASGLAAGEPYLITDESRIAVGTAANTYKAFVRQDDAIAAPEIHAATSKATPVDADELGLVDSAAANGLKKLTWANLKATLLAYFQGLFREKLTANRTYYVRTDGSDSNNGLANTSGGAFLTIQKAIDVASALDNGGFNITIQLGNGTYSAGAALKSFVGSGRIVIQGNSTTPANALVSVASGVVFAGVSVIGVYEINYMKLTSAAAGNLVSLSGATTSIFLKGNVYGSAGGGSIYAHVSAQNNASVDFGAVAYAIDGGAGYHLYSSTGGIINCNVLTVTLTGTPAFAGAYAYASMTGITRAVSNTYTGAATGKRYEALSNGIVQTAAGATVLPGAVAGSTATGGLYI